MGDRLEFAASARTSLTTWELLVAAQAGTGLAGPNDRLWAGLPADLPVFLAQPNPPAAACVGRLRFPRGRGHRARRFRYHASSGSSFTFHAVFYAFLIAVAIALWQFANSVAHVPFPSTFFLSNPGWALLSTQTMGSLTRLNGTFSEPSSLAGYLCGSVSAAAWVIFNGDKARLPRAMLYSGLLVILLCTSATGYATLAIMAAILLVHSFLVAAPEIKRRVATGALIATVLAGFAVVTVPLIAPGVATEAQEIFGATVNKQQSDSYAARTTSDHDSMTAMYESYGLGVGWGSNRSSSLGPGLCASVGVWGIFGLLVFGALLLRHMRIARLLSADAGPRMVMHGCAAGLLGTLVATMLSGPTIASPDFYLLLALLIATGARVRHDARVAMFMQPPSRRLAPARFSTAQQMKGGSS
jgi:hypothetical protein